MKEQIIKRTIQYTEPLTKPQKASLLFYLLGWDGASAVMPYLTSSEQKKLQKNLIRLNNRISVLDEINVLESLMSYGTAAKILPKNYQEVKTKYSQPSQKPTKNLASEDIARVLNDWLSQD